MVCDSSVTLLLQRLPFPVLTHPHRLVCLDVPDVGADIARGFTTASSFYIGNAALNAIDIAQAEMCLWYSDGPSCVSNCVPIQDSDFAYTGVQVDTLRSGTHRVIALMSGQLEAVTPGPQCPLSFGCPQASFYPRQIGVDAGAGPARECPSCWTCTHDDDDPMSATIVGYGWGWHAWGHGPIFSRTGSWLIGPYSGDSHNDELQLTLSETDDCSPTWWGSPRTMRWEGFYIRAVGAPSAPPLPPQPPLPPSSPPPPPLPPMPPLLPGVQHLVVIETVLHLREALASISSIGSEAISLYLRPGSHFLLDGAPLEVRANTSVHIWSSGAGSTLDGGGLSRILSVHGALRLEKVRLIRGLLESIPPALQSPAMATAMNYTAAQGAIALCGGAAILLGSHAEVDVVSTSISGMRAGGSICLHVMGGVAFLSNNAKASFANVTITDTIMQPAVDDCNHGGAVFGGIVYNSAGANANFTDVTTSGTVVSACDFIDGGVACLEQGATALFSNANIANTTVFGGTYGSFGCAFYSDGSLTLANTSVGSCPADYGGAAFITSGELVMQDGTALDGNAGSTMEIYGGTAMYALPTPAGRWLPAVACKVIREPCERTDFACVQVEEECSLILDPSSTEVATAIDGTACRPLATNQPCDLVRTPELLGRKVHQVPIRAAVQGDFPYHCLPGLLGSSDVNFQVSSFCAGQTPPGTYQNETGGTQSKPCPFGSFCPLGAINPLSCESGAGILNAATLDAGSSDPKDCRCKPGYFDRSPTSSFDHAPAAGDCIECPSGTNCGGHAGYTLATLPIERGYYRVDTTSIDLHRCPDAGTNCEDEPVCDASTSACRGTANSVTVTASVTISQNNSVADVIRSKVAANAGVSMTAVSVTIEPVEPPPPPPPTPGIRHMCDLTFWDIARTVTAAECASYVASYSCSATYGSVCPAGTALSDDPPFRWMATTPLSDGCGTYCGLVPSPPQPVLSEFQVTIEVTMLASTAILIADVLAVIFASPETLNNALFGSPFTYVAPHAGLVDYSAARQACLSHGGDIASIHSPDENELAFALTGGVRTLIGLSTDQRSSCNRAFCTSTGDDCCAPRGEAMTCSDGYTGIPTGDPCENFTVFPLAGDYECCLVAWSDGSPLDYTSKIGRDHYYRNSFQYVDAAANGSECYLLSRDIVDPGQPPVARWTLATCTEADFLMLGVLCRKSTPFLVRDITRAPELNDHSTSLPSGCHEGLTGVFCRLCDPSVSDERIDTCGQRWDSYALAPSGAEDCSGCGEAITTYAACVAASASGAVYLGIGNLGDPESWDGPSGCHIQDGSNFQFNANTASGQRAGHTPVCHSSSVGSRTALSHAFASSSLWFVSAHMTYSVAVSYCIARSMALAPWSAELHMAYTSGTHTTSEIWIAYTRGTVTGSDSQLLDTCWSGDCPEQDAAHASEQKPFFCTSAALSAAPVGIECALPSEGVCLEYGSVDSDCCGNSDAVSCANGYTRSLRTAVAEGGTWARPSNAGFFPSCATGGLKIGNTCCTPPVPPPPSSSSTSLQRVYFSPATSSQIAHCEPCYNLVRDFFLVATFGVVIGGSLLALVLVWIYRRRLSDSRKQLLSDAWRKYTPHVKLKILVGFYMIATKVDSVYEVEFPGPVKRVLGLLSLGISFGFGGINTLLECLGMRGYLALLALSMVAPVAIAVLIVSVAMFELHRKKQLTAKALLVNAMPWLLWLLFLAYPLVTNVAFEAFMCYDFGGADCLRADVAIRCQTPEHDRAIALAVVAIILYPVGLFVLTSALLYKARHDIRAGRATPISRATAFLHREFLPSLFWWELVEIFKRFVLVGLMVLAQGTIMQIIIGTLLSATFLLAQVQATPYRDGSDDFLASSASFGLVAIFICATAFKYMELTELEDIQSKMREEQKQIYSADPLLLTVIMGACVFGTLLLSCALFISQAATEGARLRREARAGKARRLRLKKNNEEVEEPPIESDHFHLFLSHVWGTGQDQMRIVKNRLREMIPGILVFLDVDDLTEIDELEGYIKRSSVVLVYCSKGYFSSKNCVRELVASVKNQKPLLALTDPEASHGGLSLHQIHQQCVEADESQWRWGFKLDSESERSTHEYHGDFVWPGGQELYNALFASEPIEWNRIGVFQDVTMRLIAERLLDQKLHCQTYVQDELVRVQPSLGKPQDSGFHIYCSPKNVGASELMLEVGNALRLEIHSTTRLVDLPLCNHMLVYLNALTWTNGETSAAFANEVKQAMEAGAHVLLAHEMMGVGGQEARHGCEFDSFFTTTPQDLLQADIYSMVAIALKGGAWREASMVMVAMALGGTDMVETRSLKEHDLVDAMDSWVTKSSSDLKAVVSSGAQLTQLGLRRLQERLSKRRQPVVGVELSSAATSATHTEDWA